MADGGTSRSWTGCGSLVERKRTRQGDSGRSKEHGAHITTAKEAAEGSGDDGGVVRRAL